MWNWTCLRWWRRIVDMRSVASYLTSQWLPLANFESTIIPLIIMQKTIVWGSIFPWVQQNTLHYTPENVIPLLCYVVTQSLEALGLRKVCLHTLHTHTHTLVYRRAYACTPQNNSLAVSHERSADRLCCNTLKLTGVHCGHNAYRPSADRKHTLRNHQHVKVHVSLQSSSGFSVLHRSLLTLSIQQKPHNYRC